jgi:hypothetical protein
MLAGTSEVLGYAAEALVLAQDWDGAREQLRRALDMSAHTAERAYLPQLHLLQARIDAAHGDEAAKQAALDAALQAAREQDAVWLVLMALVQRGELLGLEGTHAKALAQAVAQVRGGDESAWMRRARQLLR